MAKPAVEKPLRLDREEIRNAAFVREYLIDRDGAAAIRRAGLSKGDAAQAAYKFSRKPEVRAAIRRAEEDLARKLDLTAPVIQAELKAMALAPAHNWRDKNLKFKALCELSKHLGLHIERHEVTGKDGGAIEVTSLSEIEVARRVAFVLERGLMAAAGTTPVH